MEPRPEERPATYSRPVGIDVHESEDRGDDEGGEPEPRRELEPDPRRRLRLLPDRREHTVAGASSRASTHEAPGQAREQEREAELHGGKEERVVIGARVARRAEVPPDVEPVGEAPAGELRDEREQRKG